MSKLSIQDHVLLATRLYAMAMAIFDKCYGREMTEAEKSAYHSLNAQADEHQRKVNIFPRHTSFVMVVRHG